MAVRGAAPRPGGARRRGLRRRAARPEPATASTFTWVEWVDPPLGLVGQAGLRAGRRPAQAALRVALRRFARWVEREPARAGHCPVNVGFSLAKNEATPPRWSAVRPICS